MSEVGRGDEVPSTFRACGGGEEALEGREEVLWQRAEEDPRRRVESSFSVGPKPLLRTYEITFGPSNVEKSHVVSVVDGLLS